MIPNGYQQFISNPGLNYFLQPYNNFLPVDINIINR